MAILPTTTPQNVNFIAPIQPVIKVMGLGGGGCNAVNRMIELGMSGVEFIGANTDHQALHECLAPVKIQLGPVVTRGLGAGGKPQVGQAAAEESRQTIADALAGADMVFLAAGMGGGTGTGSIPVAARIAREQGAVTIAVVTTPFSFEMGRRQRNASEGLAILRPLTDTLISIPNDRLLYVAPRDLPIEVAFRIADDVLRQAVQGITELITEPGMINVDFSHIRHLMKLGGGALMSIGHGQGENMAQKAVEQALYHPLLESACLQNAAGILANFTGGDGLTLFDIQAALTNLQNQAGSQAEVVMGVINDQRMQDRVQVILVITGLGSPTLEETFSSVQNSPEKKESRKQPQVAAYPHSASKEPVGYRPYPSPVQVVDYEETIVSNQPSNENESFTRVTSNLDLPSFLRKMR